MKDQDMGIRRWMAEKMTTISHRTSEPLPSPGSEPASGEAVVTGAALAASRDAAQQADAQREAWFQYLDGQEPSNETEARWFETFRETDRRAQAQYREERRAWFEAHPEADRQALAAHEEEHTAFLRYAYGK